MNEHQNILELAEKDNLPRKIDNSSKLSLSIVKELIDAGYLSAIDTFIDANPAYSNLAITISGREYLFKLRSEQSPDLIKKWTDSLRRKPVSAAAIFLGVIIIALASFTSAFNMIMHPVQSIILETIDLTGTWHMWTNDKSNFQFILKIKQEGNIFKGTMARAPDPLSLVQGRIDGTKIYFERTNTLLQAPQQYDGSIVKEKGELVIRGRYSHNGVFEPHAVWEAEK